MKIESLVAASRWLRIVEAITAEGRYAQQAGCPGKYGHVVFTVEPAETDGLEIVWEAAEDDIPAEFRPAVERATQKFAIRDPQFEGFWFTRTRVRVVGGSYHPADSSEISFEIATSFAWDEVMKRGSFAEVS